MKVKDDVDTIERLSIDTLIEFQGNLKTLNDTNLEKLINSIKTVGFSAPFFAFKSGKKNYLLDGHQRIKALQKMREQGDIVPDLPVVFIKARDKSEAKKKLLFITSQYGKPDQGGFEEFIADLDTDFLVDIEIPDIKIDFDGINEPTENDDVIPDVQSEAVSQTSEIYELGNSLLICGDSTDLETYKRLLGIEKIDCVFTSPPYNGNTYLHDLGNEKYKRGDKKDLYRNNNKDNMPTEDYKQFLYSVLENISFSMKDASPIFWNVSYNAKERDTYGKIIFSDKNPLKVYDTIAWYKNGQGQYGKNHGILFRHCEFVFLMSKSIPQTYFRGCETNYWNISPSGCQGNGHYACFPVALPEKGILNWTKEGDLILDCFGGSGTTLIAAEKNNRKARLIELDPHYCDVIRRRWTKWARENNREVGSGGLD